jgi:hypothetical protein
MYQSQRSCPAKSEGKGEKKRKAPNEGERRDKYTVEELYTRTVTKPKDTRIQTNAGTKEETFCVHFFPLPGIFISLHLPENAPLRYIRHIGADIISRRAVQRLRRCFWSK